METYYRDLADASLMVGHPDRRRLLRSLAAGLSETAASLPLSWLCQRTRLRPAAADAQLDLLRRLGVVERVGGERAAGPERMEAHYRLVGPRYRALAELMAETLERGDLAELSLA